MVKVKKKIVLKKNMNKQALFKKNILKKKLNKRGGNETMWPRIIGFIILGILLVGVVIVVYKLGYVQKFKDLFPDYFPQNLSEEELIGLGCDKVVAQIGLSGTYGFRKQYLFMNGVNTNLQWDYENGKVISGSIVVADIEKGVVKVKPYFLDENSEEYLKNIWDGSQGNIIVNINGFKSLDNSFKLENQDYLCKTDGQAQEFIEAKGCVENCSIFNGVCKTNADSGEISYGKLDCASGECFVKENENVQSNGELKIEEFSLVGKTGEANINLLDKNEINLDNGVLRFINIKASNNDSFCYILSSDKEVLFKNYNSKYDKMSVKVEQLNPSLEKSLQFVAWNMNNKKVIKRIKLIIGELQYKDGMQISDGVGLKNKITSAKVGNIFYVSIEPIWLDGSGYNNKLINFRIIKTNENAISVEGAYSPSGGTETEWKTLNCNSWGLGSGLDIDRIKEGKNSFRETVLKECQLNKFWGLFG